MEHTRFVKLREEPRRLEAAAAWFHQKWGIPQEAYRASMEACLTGRGVPQWYLAVEGERILGAVYVEEDARCQGIAGALLGLACRDMAQLGYPTLYLLTDHTAFYERYGWEYLCPVRGDGEAQDSRMYIHRHTEK